VVRQGEELYRPQIPQIVEEREQRPRGERSTRKPEAHRISRS